MICSYSFLLDFYAGLKLMVIAGAVEVIKKEKRDTDEPRLSMMLDGQAKILLLLTECLLRPDH